VKKGEVGNLEATLPNVIIEPTEFELGFPLLETQFFLTDGGGRWEASIHLVLGAILEIYHSVS
jgi:hypothetical protein